MEKAVNFEKSTFGKRAKSMLKVDCRRMFKSKLFYIIIACALVVPIVMAVMLTMMDGTVTNDPQTGLPGEPIEAPEYVWEFIGTLPTLSKAGDMSAMGGMDVMAMCNINMAFMGVAVFVCLFVCDDFRSGYAKNLFTVRAQKADYVISKIVVGFVCGALMLLAFFVGSMLGGAICAMSFELVGGLTIGNIVMCLVAKIFLMLVFVSIFVTISVAAKQKSWLAICGSLGGGMLLFMMVGMITPLMSTLLNVLLCLAGGAMFAFGLGAVSNLILKKTSLV